MESEDDIVARRGDVELLAELRRIGSRIGARGDAATAPRAGQPFAAGYAQRLRRGGPERVWATMRDFLRRDAE